MMTEQEIQKALDAVCNQGPYSVDLAKSTAFVQVVHCLACGAELRYGATVSIPTMAHYKPGHKPVRS